MTKRKPKSPEKKTVRRKPRGLFLRVAATLGSTIARHPSVAGGCVAFTVIFSFVSANALWYQPGSHPSPMFRTRDANHSAAFANASRKPVPETGAVTTFKIERPDDTETASIDAAAAAAAAQPATGPASALVADVQQELIRRSLYNGSADGKIGPRTTAAILFFEESVGMPETGDATPELLAALKTDSTGASTLPKERPPEDVSSQQASIDPVAAAIRTAEADAKPGKDAKTLAPSGIDPELVMKIQRGLSNMAYEGIKVDGVAGEHTRATIRHFEKHYGLPETGLPNDKVLKKMKDIGAL